MPLRFSGFEECQEAACWAVDGNPVEGPIRRRDAGLGGPVARMAMTACGRTRVSLSALGPGGP